MDSIADRYHVANSDNPLPASPPVQPPIAVEGGNDVASSPMASLAAWSAGLTIWYDNMEMEMEMPNILR